MSQHAAPAAEPVGRHHRRASAQAHRRSEPAVIVQRVCLLAACPPAGPPRDAAGRPWQKDLVVDPFIFRRDIVRRAGRLTELFNEFEKLEAVLPGRSIARIARTLKRMATNRSLAGLLVAAALVAMPLTALAQPKSNPRESTSTSQRLRRGHGAGESACGSWRGVARRQGLGTSVRSTRRRVPRSIWRRRPRRISRARPTRCSRSTRCATTASR